MLGLLAGQYAPGDHHGGIERLARAGLVVRLERVLGHGEMLDEVVELLCLHAASLADPAPENHDPSGPFVRIATPGPFGGRRLTRPGADPVPSVVPISMCRGAPPCTRSSAPAAISTASPSATRWRSTVSPPRRATP